MRYLITGATGFVGPYLVQKLVQGGHHCRCLVRPTADAHDLDRLGAEIVTGDVTDPGSLSGAADRVDAVFHLATLGHMSNFAVGEERFEAVNVQGTVNVMREALRSGIKKIVHCSTVAAMGICPDVPATETSPCVPHHAYGRSKLAAEQQVLEMVRRDRLPAVIVRFSMVYGPGDRRDLLKLTRMAKRGVFPRIGNRPKLTPLIHVHDAVDALLLTERSGTVGEIYLVTHPQPIPFDRLIAILQKELGVRRIPLYVPEWAALSAAAVIEKTFRLLGRTPPVSRKNIESTLADRVFSIAKATRELGIQPAVDHESGLTETVRWYVAKGWV